MNNKKSLLIINPNQYGYMAGYHYYCKYLKDYFNIDFLCFDKGFIKIEELGINIHYIKYNQNIILRNISYLIKAFQLSRKTKHDCVFCVDFKFAFIIGLFIKSSLKVFDIRTGSLNSKKYKRRIYNYNKKLVSKLFDKTTILSESLMNLLHLKRNKTLYLPLGAEIIDNSYKKYDRLHLIYVGMLSMREIEKTIEGFALFLNKNKINLSLHYDIIGFGDNDSEKKIIESIKVNHLEEIVFFHGRKNHYELQPYYENATIGVCFIPQTPFYDVQPSTKIFEYAISGLITIATNTSENKKLITENNGVLCNDNAESFCNALQLITNNLSNFNNKIVRNSLINYKWETISREILYPILNNNS